jgi:ribose 5-phosphate isomerase A
VPWVSGFGPRFTDSAAGPRAYRGNRMTDPRQNGKRAAARAAADEVRTGTAIGLGTGSTVAFALERLAERRRDSGLDFVGVPTSEATAARARELGLPLTTLEEAGRLDLTIDGADEVDPALQLVKGGGGALTREKIVAAASDRFLVIVDATKLVPHLGATFRLPIEVLEFAWPVTARHIEELGLPNVLRAAADGAPYRTDNGHFIVDATLGPVEDLTGLEAALDTIPGVVECGLFLGMADRVYVGEADGGTRIIDAGGHAPQAGAGRAR